MDSFLRSAIQPAFDYRSDPTLLFYHLSTIALVYWAYSYIRLSREHGSFPIVNYDEKAWTYASAKLRFLTNCKQLLKEGSRKAST